MEDLYAYAFESTLTMKQIFECLNKHGPWRWSERDNDTHGEYLSTRVLMDPHIGFVKIFEAEGKYAINVKLKTDSADGRALFDEIKKKVFDTILPSITATLLGPVDDYG